MSRLQRVISRCAERRYADMSDGHPSFEPVMSGTMQQVGDADGSRGPCGLKACKARIAVHYIVRNKLFFASSCQHISR